LPVITPSYLYTFVALVLVSTLLVFTFMAYTDTLRISSEARRMKNLMDHMAFKSTELLTITLATNASVEDYVQMPTTIGSKQYWLLLRNDSARAWLEGGFGDIVASGADLKVYIPAEGAATGLFVGGHGAAHIRCYVANSVLHLQLTDSTSGV